MVLKSFLTGGCSLLAFVDPSCSQIFIKRVFKDNIYRRITVEPVIRNRHRQMLQFTSSMFFRPLLAVTSSSSSSCCSRSSPHCLFMLLVLILLLVLLVLSLYLSVWFWMCFLLFWSSVCLFFSLLIIFIDVTFFLSSGFCPFRLVYFCVSFLFLLPFLLSFCFLPFVSSFLFFFLFSF